MVAIDTASQSSVTLYNPASYVVAGQGATVDSVGNGFFGGISIQCLNARMGVTCLPSRGSPSLPGGSRLADRSYYGTAAARDCREFRFGKAASPICKGFGKYDVICAVIRDLAVAGCRVIAREKVNAGWTLTPTRSKGVSRFRV